MSVKEKELKERERELALKALRDELEEKIFAELPEGGLRPDETQVRVEQIDRLLEVNPEHAKRIVEALLFASSKPLTTVDIRRVLKDLKPLEIEKIILQLKEEYEAEKRGFKVFEIAGGYEIGSDPQFAPWIMKLELQKKARQTSNSALESLAILAYKQPVTRQEIEDLRGVSVSHIMVALLEKNLIKIVGRKEVPGRPFLYGTTEKFLEHFGLKSLTDLPEIQEIRELVEKSISKEKLLGTPQGTVVENTEAVQTDNQAEAVSAEGQENAQENSEEQRATDSGSESAAESDGSAREN